MINQYAELLTPAQVRQIHEASLEILEQVGVRVLNEEARQRFEDHGCGSDRGTGIVRIPGRIIEQHLQSIPPTFTFHGRDPQYDRTIPADKPVISTASAAPNILDPETAEVRRSRSDDIARIAHLVNTLPGYDTFSISVTADDAPPGQFSLARLYPALKHCRKPVLASPPDISELDNLYQLGSLIAGSEAAFLARPFMTFVYAPVISPLTMNPEATEKLIRYSERGIPSFGAVVPSGGISAPFSLTGTLLQTNAEVLAQVVLEQMVAPGRPTVYCVLPTLADIRTAGYAPGGIETGTLTMGCAQMARYYNIPSGGFVGQTNAKCNDAQSGFESGMSTMAAMLAGLDFYYLGGLLGAMMVFDYGKLVIDHEISLMLKQAARGVKVTPEEMVLDVIAEVGPGGFFTDRPHTVKHMRSVAFLPQIADRRAWSQWEEAGRPDVHAQALRQVFKTLAQDNPAAISPDLDARIRAEFEDLVAGDLVSLQGKAG